jgi:hypothetical protein
MKNLILIIFVLFASQSMAQNPAEKSVLYVPVHQQPGYEQSLLEYDARTTRIVQVFEVPKTEKNDSTLTDSVQKAGMESGENYTLKATVNADSNSVILEYKLETDVIASILIQDVKGNTTQSLNTKNQHDQITIITHDWMPGIYIAGLYVNGKLVESIKFTVLK